MKYIKRLYCPLDRNNQLERILTLNNFPVFMGAVNDSEYKNDLKAKLKFNICKMCGSIQLESLIPQEYVYKDQHNDGIGKIWNQHYNEFSKFIGKYYKGNILEIGGSIGILAKIFTDKYKKCKWTIIEPNPIFLGNKSIKVIRGWFDEKFKYKKTYNTIVHSHVFEHIYDPVTFLENIFNNLSENDIHIFSFPNMEMQLKNKYTNCLNFEHTILLSEDIVDILIERVGFKIIQKKYFSDHSIFYATEKNVPVIKNMDKSLFKKYKSLFNDFVKYHIELIKKLNSYSKNYSGEIYLFGAHIFSQYLISFGLKTKKIVSILDNSNIKIGKRLYGTKLKIYSPEIIRDKNNVAVIVKVAGYREEIVKQLKEINPNVEIWE